MLHDLDETLKYLLIQKARLDPSEVDISFDVPTRDWSTPVTRPTINLYLYDLRENRELRAPYRETIERGKGMAALKQGPVRVDVSYMVTCWTSAAEDQHRLLWRVLAALMKHSPLPDDVLQGKLRNNIYPVRTEVAQPDGVLRNVSDFWGALDNQLRPTISLTATLELDLETIELAPLVFATMLKVGQRAADYTLAGDPRSSNQITTWELMPVPLGGRVHTPDGRPVLGAAVRLLAADPGRPPAQRGSTHYTGAHGEYLFPGVPPGQYTLVVEVEGHTPQHFPLTLVARERGEPLPEFVHEVEIGHAQAADR